LTSCNGGSAYDACVHSTDPTTGTRLNKCPPSTFETGNFPWRTLNGIVWRGDNGVSGAVVNISSTHAGPPVSTISGANGFFGPVDDVALRYDVTTRVDKDVLTMRGLAVRYLQPSIDLDTRSLAQAWQKRLDLRLAAPVPSNHAVAFFASGGTVYGVTGDLEHGVSIIDPAYSGPATIHAVEYEKDKDLGTAVGYGKVDVFANAAETKLVTLAIAPIEKYQTVTIGGAPPPGFPAGDVEIIVNFSRSSVTHLTTTPNGVAKRVPVIPNVSSYSYRIRTSAPDGTVSDTGEVFLDLFAAGETKASLYPAPVPDAPDDGARVGGDVHLVADGTGVLEHVLVSEADGSTIHVIAMDREVTLPDFAAVGAPLPKGRYAWSVRSFPKVTFVDTLSGIDARRYAPVGISKPRVLTFE
jgi:hypothetical protein